MAVTMCNGYGLDSVESSSPRASGGAPLHHPGNPVQSQASSYTGLQYSFQQTPSVLDLNMSPVAPKVRVLFGWVAFLLLVMCHHILSLYVMFAYQNLTQASRSRMYFVSFTLLPQY